MLEDPVFNFVGASSAVPGGASTAQSLGIPWTCGDAFQGTQIFGGTGSGKSSTSGRRFAVGLLRVNRHDPTRRFGGLVLTAKNDDLEAWINPNADRPGNMVSAGRGLQDVIVFGPNHARYAQLGLSQPPAPMGFNFLEYERQLYDRLNFPATPNLVATLLTAMSAGGERGPSSDPYWDEAVRQLLTNAIDLVATARSPLSLQTVNDVIRSAPQSPGELSSPAWRDGLCASLLATATDRRDLTDAQAQDLYQTVSYWCEEFPSLASRTRSLIVNSFTARASALLRSPFREMFSGTTTVSPDDTHRGKVVILDLPIKTYGESGRIAQLLFKTVWQKATEWRKLNELPNPVFLWADESQYFVTPYDVTFQQTARSQRAAVVYLTQSLPNYHVAFGDRDGRARTDSLMGCLQTKVFHANSDVVTNEWAQRLFGQKQGQRRNVSDSTSTGRQDGAANQSRGSSIQETLEHRVSADRFAQLQPASKDQPAHAFIFVLGKRWDEQRQFLGWRESFSRSPEREPGVFPK
jgi:hypothetical protein